MTSRPRSLEVEIESLRRRLLRLGKEKRRAALLQLMQGLKFHPLSYGPKRPRSASKRAARSRQVEVATP